MSVLRPFFLLLLLSGCAGIPAGQEVANDLTAGNVAGDLTNKNITENIQETFNYGMTVTQTVIFATMAFITGWAFPSFSDTMGTLFRGVGVIFGGVGNFVTKLIRGI